ncbi:MAG: hypothetical protein HYX23_02100 [Candidatus Zambryskibacteria bacterium]|nr:hypothetical protein [Candidatus Zambryskibacteria bacterium]
MIFKNAKTWLILLSACSMILLTFLILEIYKTLRQNREATELINLADYDAKVGVLAQSIRIMQNSAKEDIALFDEITLSGDKLVSFIEKIEATGKILGLNVTIVSVEKLEDKKSAKPDTVRIIMETKGAWSPTISLLHAIESLPYRVMMDRLNLSKDETDWRLKINLSLYSFD